MRKRTIWLILALLVPAAFLALPGGSASARLEPKEWRALQDQAKSMFGKPGNTDAKLEILKKLLEDEEKRAWLLLVDGLVGESEVWLDLRKAITEKEAQIDEVQAKPMAKRYPEEQKNLETWKEELTKLEETARAENLVFRAYTGAVAHGPQILRKYVFDRAKASREWSVRAAAAGVAAVHPEEKISFEYLSRALDTDKDARVRMAGLDAMRLQEGDAGTEGEGEGETPKPVEGATPDVVNALEGLILGRLGDPDWGVQLLAVQIVKDRKLTAALPHLINGLAFASPRVAEAIGEVLRELTGENFDPYADVWAKWWEEHKETFASQERVKAGKSERPPSDAHFYGLPIKSDRVLFIIDTSSSMKLETQNANPAEKWKPKGPITGDGGGPPPPPPPEEILSGPKIDVAKHELKKAIEKLPPSSMFNIIAFNTAVMPWRDTMQKADEKTKKDALQWVRALEAEGITYVDGALRLGFKMAGLASFDKAYFQVNIDTMIVLSDGAPTDDHSDATGKAPLMDDEFILQHVREWNRHKRIVIHCIGVDMQEGIVFLQKLAAENGGEYIDR